jgi:hypothetical protein
MARKSVLDGGASQVYESCYADNCDNPASKAVVITNFNTEGATHDIAPLCNGCAKKAKDNAPKRGLPTPHQARLTKARAQDFREMEGRSRVINPKKTGSWTSPEKIMEVHESRIELADREHAMGANPTASSDTSTSLGRAYRDRHMTNVNRRRTPQQREAILGEALKGLRSGS